MGRLGLVRQTTTTTAAAAAAALPYHNEMVASRRVCRSGLCPLPQCMQNHIRNPEDDDDDDDSATKAIRYACAFARHVRIARERVCAVSLTHTRVRACVSFCTYVTARRLSGIIASKLAANFAWQARSRLTLALVCCANNTKKKNVVKPPIGRPARVRLLKIVVPSMRNHVRYATGHTSECE